MELFHQQERGFPMTISRPWYKRYPANFFSGTSTLSYDLRACYSVLIDLLYDHNRAIPDDERWIKMALGMTPRDRRWRAWREILLQCGKLQLKDGKLVCPCASDMAETAFQPASNGVPTGLEPTFRGKKSNEISRARARSSSYPTDKRDKRKSANGVAPTLRGCGAAVALPERRRRADEWTDEDYDRMLRGEPVNDKPN